MLGCMVESAIAATAAAHLSPLVDWADIDGPFLTASDPFYRRHLRARQDSCCPTRPGWAFARAARA